MEKNDELPEDYHDLTPEHYAKMTVSRVIYNRWISKEKDSCEYLVRYTKADKSVCEKIYPRTAMDHMCKRTTATMRKHPENFDLGGLVTSYAEAHMNLERQIEDAKREVHDAWDAFQCVMKKLLEEAGKDPMKYLSSDAGIALTTTLFLCEKRLCRAQESFVGRLGFRTSVFQEHRKKHRATLVHEGVTTKTSTTTVRNESTSHELTSDADAGDNVCLIFQCTLCEFIASNEHEAWIHSSFHSKS